VGILFAIIYATLWSVGIGSPTWWWGLIFGAVHGLLVIVMLLLAMRRYPPLSEIISGFRVMAAILLNHIVFGVVVALVYST
jgi:hypothetical protein